MEEKTTYTIDNQEYTVIARCKKDNNIENSKAISFWRDKKNKQY